jgi:regulator of sigma E protease
MNTMDLFHTIVSKPFEFVRDYGGPFIVVLSLLIFVHEWGHYIVARMCGVKVVKFSIGFGKELFGRTDKNGTRWKFCMIPLGGYVQMFGDTDPASAHHTEGVEEGNKCRPHTPEEKRVAFYAQPISRRAAIVFAGPAINYLFAMIILTGLYWAQGEPYLPAVAADLLEGQPAAEAGIQIDDKILKLNGHDIERFEDLREITTLSMGQEMDVELVHVIKDAAYLKYQEQLRKFKALQQKSEKAAKEGKPGALTPEKLAAELKKIERPELKWSDKPVHLKVTPRKIVETDRFGFKHEMGRIGIVAPRSDIDVMKPHNLFSAIGASLKTTWKITSDTMQALGQMVMGTRSTDELGGILRIGAYAGDFAQQGLVAFITFAGLLSVNLGLINILPIPLLDGGYLAMYAMEKVRGKPLNERIQEYALRVGLVFLLGIMFLATWNDLVQLKVVDYVRNLISG